MAYKEESAKETVYTGERARRDHWSQEAGEEFQRQFVTGTWESTAQVCILPLPLQRQDSLPRHDLGQTVQPKVSIFQPVTWDEYLQLWGIIVRVK